MKEHKPGIYWNGINLDFGFWVLQPSGRLYFSGTPVAGGVWTNGGKDIKLDDLHYLCDLKGRSDESTKK